MHAARSGCTLAERKPLPIAVLASGRGSNLQALIDAIEDGRLAARIVLVASDRPGCVALARAERHGIATWASRPHQHASRAAFDRALFDAVAHSGAELVVCAGYMRIVGADSVARFAGRIINIHPSLLPRYPGLDTHARVLAAGDAEHGASVHVLTPELDAGPVLAQARVPVLDGDDAEGLAARVLAREHPLLIAVTALFTQQRLRVCEDRVLLDGRPLAAPLQLHPDNSLT